MYDLFDSTFTTFTFIYLLLKCLNLNNLHQVRHSIDGRVWPLADLVAFFDLWPTRKVLSFFFSHTSDFPPCIEQL